MNPIKVEPYGPGELFVSWSDGTSYVLPYPELRFYCPCAGCIDEHTGKRIVQRESIGQDVRPLSVQPVGRYALQFSWSDGHSTGMYHFDRLHEICKARGRPL